MRTLPFILLLLLGTTAFSQQKNKASASGALSGNITDEQTGEPIAFAYVGLFGPDSSVVANATTDFDGLYYFAALKPGTYKIRVHYVGYKKKEITGLKIGSGLLKCPVKMEADSKMTLEEVQIVSYYEPLIQLSVTSSCVITREQVSSMPNVRGGRSANTVYLDAGYNTEEYSSIKDNGFKETGEEPLSTFSIDVDKASYSNVRRFLHAGQLPPADAVRVEELINYFGYEYPQPEGKDPFSITTEYTECPWNRMHNLVHIGMQSKAVSLDNMPANNLVFLLDVSGSMEDANKLPLVKAGLRMLVDQMRPKDKIAIVVYAGAAGLVLEPTSGAHKEKIYGALDQLQAGGSTAGGAGILLAYKTAKKNFDKKANNRVILATDGDFNVGTSSDGELTRMIEKERESGVFLTVLGFGTGNYKDSKMEQLADKGNGNYAYIDDLLEAKKVLVKEMGGTLLTVAKDVKLQIEFNPSKVKAYRLVGYENRLLNDEDFNDDKKDAGELGAGHTVTAIYEIIPAGSTEPVASVDPLKYQQVQTTENAKTNEVLTVKFRYKEPDADVSQLLSSVVEDKKKDFQAASENCRFSCAVAEFGMLLRDSEFKGDSNYKSVIKLAKSAKGKDEEGYRAEFVHLAEKAELLKK